MVRNGELIVPALLSDPLVATKNVAESSSRDSRASTAAIRNFRVVCLGPAAVARGDRRARPAARLAATRTALAHRSALGAMPRRHARADWADRPRETLDTRPWGIDVPLRTDSKEQTAKNRQPMFEETFPRGTPTPSPPAPPFKGDAIVSARPAGRPALHAWLAGN
jgi:hypothetical protein